MIVDRVDEPINMLVMFKNGGIIPISFTCRGKQYKDFTVDFSWKVHYGQGERIFFSLKQQKEYIYEVYLDTTSLKWTLHRVFNLWI